MANSTQLTTDLHTLAGSTFTAASLAKAHATDNIDLAGMASTAAAAVADLKASAATHRRQPRRGGSCAHPRQQHSWHAFLKPSKRGILRLAHDNKLKQMRVRTAITLN